MKKALEIIDDFARDIMKKRESKDLADKKDLMSMYLDVKNDEGEKMSPQQVRNSSNFP
jgi:cytochrome P450